MTQSGGGGEYSLGIATLTMRGDMQPLERDLARIRAVIADMEKRGTTIPASKPPPPPPPETQRGYEGLTKTIEALRRSMQGDGEAFTMLSQQLRASGEAAGAAGGGGGFGGATNALGSMLGMAGKAVPMLAELGLAATGIQAIFGGLRGAINAVLGPLEQLSAQAGRLNKQVAEAGIFAAQSFSILGPDGKLVEGTARQMQMVRGAILKEYRAIQQEVTNISGATASQIYDGFNIILSNVSSLGEQGTLENSAKLATRLAAGMNTLGIPGFQLRQEVNALMMGDIDRNAMLATKLGITGEDVRQQQAQGTFYDFLMRKLEKLYEGQKVLALSLENVKSNFDEVNEAIASEAGAPLERDTAQMMQSILGTFKNLQGSFTGFFKSIAEAVGPIIKLLGPVVAIFTSIGAIASSAGRVIMDVFGVVTALFGGQLLPALTLVARTVELIASGIQLVAELVNAGLDPIKALLNVGSEGDTDRVNSFFDNLAKNVEYASNQIEGLKKGWSNMVLDLGVARLRWQMSRDGASEKEIKEAETNFRDRFKLQTALPESVELRSLKLPPNIANYLEDLNNRLGIGSARALAISKQWAEIKQKGYQNEIKSLEQGLTLMNKQREVAEAMSAVAAARRALVARGYELGVQVAASPEAKLAAEARLADLKLRQEKEAIAERRGILLTERELQQRQMLIQQTQIKIQQEQLKIQLAEARADQVRVTNATQAVLKGRANSAPSSPEWAGFTRELNVLNAESTRNAARVAGAREALRLAFEAEAQLGTINGLEAQRRNLQAEQLDIQAQSAVYSREQQRLLAQISEAEQQIANDLTRATNEQNRRQRALEAQSEAINRQNTLLERQGRLEKAQAELSATRAKAELQAAERLQQVQSLQERARRGGGGTASVIEAQIAAAAAGVTSMESAAAVQQRLYEAREKQMTREHQLQQRQLEVQQMREASEARIEQLKLQRAQVEIALQRAQITAELARSGLTARRDTLSAQLAGAAGVPMLGGLPAAIRGGARTSRSRDPDGEATGWDIVMPGGRGAPVQAPISLTITGTGFQGRGAGASGTGYGNWISGEFSLGGKTYELLLGHFDRVDVARGMQVPAGARLGTQGITGRTFGSHVTTHVNPKGGASQADAWRALDALTRTWEGGAPAAPALPPPPTRVTNLGGGFTLRTAGANIPLDVVEEAMRKARQPARTAGGPTPIPVIPFSEPGASAGVATSSSLQAQGQRDQIQDLNSTEARLVQTLQDLNEWLEKLADTQSLQRESLSEQQQAERAQFEFEQRRLMLTAKVMETPQGQLGMAVGDATSGSISTSLSGALQALLSGGDVRQAVSSALAQAGQSLMQATLDALLNPLLSQLEGGIFKAITGVDVNAVALQGAATAQQGAAATLTQAGVGLFSAANALLAAAGVGGAANAGGTWASIAGSLPSLLGGLGGGLDFSGAFSAVNSLVDFAAAPSLVSGLGSFTPGRAGGGEIQFGLDYLVGENNAEIVRFNKAGGKVFSNRALTRALGVPFQRTPGGGAAVADGGGDFLGVPFMGAGPTRAAGGSRGTPGIPFLKASPASGGMAATAAGGGAPGLPMTRSSSLRLRLDTRVINGVEYATVEQVRQAAAEAAALGRDSVYDGMRNNPSIQRSLGLRG